MPPKKWKKIQVWWKGKWDIKKNLKRDSSEIKVKANPKTSAVWVKSRKDIAEAVAAMNEVKWMKWITWWRKRKYTPQALLDKINEYFLSNAMFEEVYKLDPKWRVLKDDDWMPLEIIDYHFIWMKAMSIYWLCNHLEISYWSFREMSSTKDYWHICLQAKQRIMDDYVTWGLTWKYDSRVSSAIINMQLQNERIEEWLQDESPLFQKIEVNIVTKDWQEQKKKIDPIKIITVDKKKD